MHRTGAQINNEQPWSIPDSTSAGRGKIWALAFYTAVCSVISENGTLLSLTDCPVKRLPV